MLSACSVRMKELGLYPLLDEHPLPHVLALVVFLGQTVRGTPLTTEEAIDLAVGATAHASSLILLFVLPGPLLKLGLLGVDRDKLRVDGAHVPGGTRYLLPILIVIEVTRASLTLNLRYGKAS